VTTTTAHTEVPTTTVPKIPANGYAAFAVSIAARMKTMT
jgi:hypothetical protein